MNNRDLLAKEIVKRYIALISGTNEKQIIKYNPNDRIYVGKLSPRSSADAFSSSVLIKQISVDFRIEKESLPSAELEIFPQGLFFYRVLPSYEQQKEYFYSNFSETFLEEKNSEFNDILTKYNAGLLNDEMIKHKVGLLPIYEKISIERNNCSVKIKLSEIYNQDYSCGNTSENSNFIQEIKKMVDKLCEDAKNAHNILPCQFRDKVSISDLLDEESWEAYKKKQIKREEFDMFPKYDFSVVVDIKGIGEYVDITVALSNETEFGDECAGFGQSGAKNDPYRINTLFNSGLKVRCSGASFVPIELDYFSDDYKYDPRVYALGNNCNVEYDLDNMEIQTVHVPVFVQNRLKTNDAMAIKFDDLIDNPLIILNDVYSKMIIELKKWKSDYLDRTNSGTLTELGKIQFKNEIDNFEIETKRFKTGIELIEKYNAIKDSFILMNKSFRACAKGYDSWRLFQIVFIVSLILDVTANEPSLMIDDELKNKAKTDDIDILYFPTGGGKTEAFLGILIFNLFFDRIRGKERGVTAFLKYPLRLLSVQQVQRVSNILAAAECLRVEEGLEGDRFSLGYFVGGGNTPNHLDEKLEKELLEMTSDEIDDKYRLLDICPFCGEPIHIVYDSTRRVLRHICKNNACKSNGELPLYMVDEDIYCSIPSVIISTVDKMTAIGFNTRFHNLLSGARYKCPIHGYTDRDRCLIRGCKCEPHDFIKVKMKDPAPTLLIQDELHLIKESLGAYDSHYETFLEYYIKKLSGCNRGIKVIGATATISAYEIQAKHLYWKNAIRFPVASPYIDHNFYAYIDPSDTGRIIIGYAPFGKAIINSVAYSLQYLRRVVYELYDNPLEIIKIAGMKFEGTEEEQILAAKKLMEDYWIILEYNNVKQESNRVLQAIEDPINTELLNEHIDPIISRKMTGDDTFQEVRSTLSAIEHTKSVITELDFNMIAATSMISHGVDADRFNLMLFYGIPGNTAEYIQAYSRVGRKYPGIVIDIIRPSREKDQSYLKNFIKFHEYKDILVDSVSINRWASKAVENTLPGIISGILLNYYLYELQYSEGTNDISKYKDLKYAVQNNIISTSDLKEHAYQIYRCSANDSSIGKLYQDTISRLIDELIENLKNASFEGNMYLTNVFEKCAFHVMQSLRDTDKQILVEMK